jgi:putative transposase
MEMKLRNLKSGQYYHIYNRGNRKQPIAYDSNDKDYYVKTLHNKFEVFGECLLAYAIMNNHFHLLVRVVDHKVFPNLMKGWCCQMAMHFNYKYKTVGRMFQNRYRSRLATGDLDVINLSRYIHNNPSELPSVKSISDLVSYKWSSFKVYRCASGPMVVDTSHILGYFNDRESYTKYVLTQNPRRRFSYINSQIDKQLEELIDPRVRPL